MTTLLRLPEVLERTKLSRSKLYELLVQEKFPRPGKIGDRINAWRDSDIEEWINATVAEH